MRARSAPARKRRSPTRRKPIKIAAAPGPGPGSYDPQPARPRTGVSFRGSSRQQAGLVYAGCESVATVVSPGPAAYGTLRTSGEDSYAFSFGNPNAGGRTSLVEDGADTPGPGEYKPPTTVGSSVESTIRSAPTAGFGCGSRDLAKKQYAGASFQTPGTGESPGFAYARHWSTMGKQPAEKSAPVFSFGGGGERFSNPASGESPGVRPTYGPNDYGPTKMRAGPAPAGPNVKIVDCTDARSASAETNAALAKIRRHSSENRQIMRERHELRAGLAKAQVRKPNDYSWLRVHGDQSRMQTMLRRGDSRTKLDGVAATVFGTADRFRGGGGLGAKTCSPGPAYAVPSDFDRPAGFSFSCSKGSAAPGGAAGAEEPGPGAYNVLLDERVRAEIDGEFDSQMFASSSSSSSFAPLEAESGGDEEREEEREEREERQARQEQREERQEQREEDANARPDTADAVLSHSGPVIARKSRRPNTAGVGSARGGRRSPPRVFASSSAGSSLLSRPSTASSARDLYEVAKTKRFGPVAYPSAPGVHFGSSDREQMRQLFAPGELNADAQGRSSPGPAAHGDAMPPQCVRSHSFGGKNINRSMELRTATDRGPDSPHVDFGAERTSTLRRAPRPSMGSSSRDAALRIFVPNMPGGGSSLDTPGPDYAPRGGVGESGRGPGFPLATREREGALAEMLQIPGPGTYNVRRMFQGWDDWKKH